MASQGLWTQPFDPSYSVKLLTMGNPSPGFSAGCPRGTLSGSVASGAQPGRHSSAAVHPAFSPETPDSGPGPRTAATQLPVRQPPRAPSVPHPPPCSPRQLRDCAAT